MHYKHKAATFGYKTDKKEIRTHPTTVHYADMKI